MSTIVIRRCPLSPQIDAHAQGINRALMKDYGRFASVEDGEENEFSLLVDGLPVLQRTDNCLPSVEEVESAIQNTGEDVQRHVTRR